MSRRALRYASSSSVGRFSVVFNKRLKFSSRSLGCNGAKACIKGRKLDFVIGHGQLNSNLQIVVFGQGILVKVAQGILRDLLNDEQLG